jgi:tetratricopeptide (TPR) repeat protein
MLPIYLNSFNNNINTTYGQIQTEQTAGIIENDIKGLVSRGNFLDDLGNFTGAIQYYDKILAIAPNDADALYNKGLVLDQLGK